MTTIKDIAKLAGVSVSTVSNIINNKHSVSIDLYNRVFKVMVEQNYHPNIFAANLRNNNTRFIGVILDSFDGYYGQMLEGIYTVLNEQQCQAMIKLVKYTSCNVSKEMENLVKLGVKGIIVASKKIDIETIDKYIENKMPIVLLDSYFKNKDYNTVFFDNRDRVYEVTKSITEKQSKKIGLLISSKAIGSEYDCFDGYMSAMEIAGVESEKRCVITVGTNKETAFAELVDLLSSKMDLPDHFIISNDFLADSFKEACRFCDRPKINYYILSGDNWCTFQQGCTKIIKRDAIKSGMQAAYLLLSKIESPLTFATEQVEIKSSNITNIINKTRAPVDFAARETIKVLFLESYIKPVVVKLVRDFEQTYNINVEYSFKKREELRKTIMINCTHNEAPADVFMVDMPWLKDLIVRRRLLKLNDYCDVEKLSEKYLDKIRIELMNSNKNVYALPAEAGNQVLIYRKDLFTDQLLKKTYYKEYGLELHPPKTWMEFNLIAKFFTKRYNPNSPIEYGTCMMGRNPDGLVMEYLPRQWAYKGKLFKGKNPVIYSVQNIKALKNLCESFKYSYPYCDEFTEDEQITEFANNDIAMIATYNIHLTMSSNPNIDAIKKNIEYYIMPGKSSLLGCWLFGINSKSNKPNSATKFIEWACSDSISIQSTIMGGFIPKKNVVQNQQIQMVLPWLQNIEDQLEMSRVREVVYNKQNRMIQNEKIESILANGIRKAVKGECTPEKALLEVETIYKEIIK